MNIHDMKEDLIYQNGWEIPPDKKNPPLKRQVCVGVHTTSSGPTP